MKSLPQTPIVQMFMGGLLLLLGVSLGASGFHYESIECARSHGTCVMKKHDLFQTYSSRSLGLADVVAIDFNEYKTRNGRYGQTVLFTPTGAEVLVAKDTVKQAREHHTRLQSFFAGRIAEVKISGQPAWIVIGLGVLVGLFGLYQLFIGIVRLRHPQPVSKPPPTSFSAKKQKTEKMGSRVWRRAIFILGGIVLLNVGVLSYAFRAQAKLILHCQQRCEFDGGACLPGKTIELLTSPGRYTIRIWDPSSATMWREREVTLEAGQTTEFTCSLSDN